VIATYVTWLVVGFGCRAPDEDGSGGVDSGEPPLCREVITDYEYETAPVGHFGTGYLADSYEWNAVDWTSSLHGSGVSTFSRVFGGIRGMGPVVVEWVPAWTDDAIWPCREARATRVYITSEVWVDSTALHATMEGTLDLFADEPYALRWGEVALELSEEWQALADAALLELDPTGAAVLSLDVQAKSILLAGESGGTVQPFWEGSLYREGKKWARPAPP